MASLRAYGDYLYIACGGNVVEIDIESIPTGPVNSRVVYKFSLPESDTNGANGSNTGDDNAERSAAPAAAVKAKADDAAVSNHILAFDVSSNGASIAVCDNHKNLHVFHRQNDVIDDDRWALQSSRCVSRRCTAVKFTSDNQTILVANKSGDVFSFPLESSVAEDSSSTKKTTAITTTTVDDDDTTTNTSTAISTTANNNNDTDCGDLVLGHLSMLLDMVLIDNDKYVVTSDRDEKIRISCFPDAYNIHTYCLGHTSFVISMDSRDDQRLLFSGSGDVSICMWSYDGVLMDQRHCLEDFPQLKDSSDAKTDDITTKPSSPASQEVTVRHAVTQICCSHQEQLLYVALYKCPHILIYRWTTTNDDHILEPYHIMTKQSPDESVVTICVRDSDDSLWVLREAAWPELKLEGFSVKVESEGPKIHTVIPDTDSVGAWLNDVLEVPDWCQDPIPTLWKSQTDGYIQEYMERKRQRKEGDQNKQKQQKKPRWGKKSGKTKNKS